MLASGMSHIVEKLSMRVTTLLCNSPQSQVSTRSYGPPNYQESQFLEFQDSQRGSPKKSDIWVHALWLIIENTTREKGSGSPKFGPWWILWVNVCPWLVRAPKVLQLCTNQLVVCLYMFIWNIDLLVIHPNPHPGTLTHPFHPQMLRTRVCTLTPSIIFTFKLAFESFKEFGGASVRLYRTNEVWLKLVFWWEFE